MITPGDAQTRILALARPTGVETVRLIDAAGRWSAEKVLAKRTQPARDLSAMDGYAIRFADMPGPWRITGESAAGAPFAGALNHGEAIRISTGAALPSGADTIVIQEDVARTSTELVLTGAGPLRAGNSVRYAGSDFASGDRLIECGQSLNAAAIALAAMGGHGDLAVHRRPRVAIMSTGDELVPPGCDPGPDSLPCTNDVMLAAMLRNFPVDTTDLGIVPDDRSALADALGRAHNFDILVTTGGASVGDHDLVRPCLLDAGAKLDFWKVAMRPGKPLMAGTLGRTVVLGLPGNPASAFVTATLFLLPLVRRMLGAAHCMPTMTTVEVAHAMPDVGPRTDFVRARWSDGRLTTLPSSDSGIIGPLAIADALLVRPANTPSVDAGARLTAIILGP